MAERFAEVEEALVRLNHALSSGHSYLACLRRWSAFVRIRDGHRCVDCHSRAGLSAHHICRKILIVGASFDTGNGITLCRSCHREVHAGFNRRPDPRRPIDAQGGEKLHLMERLYSVLLDDAVEWEMLRSDFYYIGDHLLNHFENWQGHLVADLPGFRLEQAYLILAQPERQLRNAIAEANGFHLGQQAILPGELLAPLADGSTLRTERFVGYRVRSPRK